MAQIPTTPNILDSDLAPEWTSGPDRTDLRVEFEAIKGNVFDGERVDGMYRGGETGVRVLAVTSRRLMMVESTTWEDRLALTSVPYSRVSSVSFVASADSSVATSTIVGIRVQGFRYEVSCDSVDLAREAHDLITWSLVSD